MDPVSLAGLALAGNIVQFLEFGYKLVTKANKIRKDGSVVEYTHMEIVTADLSRCAEKLRSSQGQPNPSQVALAGEEASLGEICQGCLHVAGEFNQVLRALQSQGRPSRWKSFRQALKSILGKERVAELKALLDLYSEQMDRRVLLSARSRIDLVLLQQDQQYSGLDTSIQVAVDRMRHLEGKIQHNQLSIQDGNDKVLQSIECFRADDRNNHGETHQAIAQLSTRFQENSAEVMLLAADVLNTLKSALANSRQQNQETAELLSDCRREGKKQIEDLKEEIRLLKLELGEGLQQIVASVGRNSLENDIMAKSTRNITNNMYNLWMAKELVLGTILQHFKSHVGDWASALEIISWKLQLFGQTNTAPIGLELENWGAASEMVVDFADIPEPESIPRPLYEAMDLSINSITDDPVSDGDIGSREGRTSNSGSDWGVIPSNPSSPDYFTACSLETDSQFSGGEMLWIGAREPSAARRARSRSSSMSLRVRASTHLTRLMQACIRCRLQRIRCQPDPVNPGGPCLICQRSKTNRFPCLRYRIIDVTLFRTGINYIPFYRAHPMTGPSYGDFHIEKHLTSTPRISLCLAQIGSMHFRISLHEFVPPLDGPSGSPQHTDFKGEHIYSVPWCIVDPDVAFGAINDYIDTTTEFYLYTFVDDTDHLAWDIFQFAYKQSTFPVPNKPLQTVIRLWVACRLIEGGWRCWLDAMSAPTSTNSASSINWDSGSVPSYLDYQLTSLVIHRILVPLQREVLRELQSRFSRFGISVVSEDWSVFFMTCFILLHNYELQIQFQSKVSLRRKSPVLYLDMPLVRRINAGANVVLAYFHHSLKGERVFTSEFAWKSVNFRREEHPDPEQISFLEKCRDIVVQRANRFDVIKHSDDYRRPYWYTSQLFDYEWTPRTTLDDSPP
ncbi:hypothetical protein B0H66DRAFT_529996 [Apodospora peruviana]|uniref:Zn(2)-C6 fungal-type domain-containing protein n=1 Tax=Apodospora peruviana TaxID=516989 RepID=A0AAE0IKD9_9PEZI|nr:hypothetical protein B0H66DRAFT_529996 [Apodospora peruviana]